LPSLEQFSADNPWETSNLDSNSIPGGVNASGFYPRTINMMMGLSTVKSLQSLPVATLVEFWFSY
jgi:hypothetical protein